MPASWWRSSRPQLPGVGPSSREWRLRRSLVLSHEPFTILTRIGLNAPLRPPDRSLGYVGCCAALRAPRSLGRLGAESQQTVHYASEDGQSVNVFSKTINTKPDKIRLLSGLSRGRSPTL